MADLNNKLIKAESDIIVRGNRSLVITNKTLASYYLELREWWNSLDDSLKFNFIYLFINEDDLPRELIKKGKIYNRKRQTQETVEWEIIGDECGKIQREPYDYELERIVLSRKLNIDDCPIDLKPLSVFQHLVTLVVRANWDLYSLNGIEELTELREIYLTNTRVSSLESLKKLVKLEKINFHYSNVESLSPLSNLNKLVELNIVGSFDLNDLTPISSLKNLINLNCSELGFQPEDDFLSGNQEEIDFSPIANLNNLQVLICEDNLLANLNFLRALTNLNKLNFNEATFKNPDLAPLENLKKLTWLKLTRTNIEDISSLFCLNNLKYLWVDETNVPDHQIKLLSKQNPECIIIIKDGTFHNTTSAFYKNGILNYEMERFK